MAVWFQVLRTLYLPVYTDGLYRSEWKQFAQYPLEVIYALIALLYLCSIFHPINCYTKNIFELDYWAAPIWIIFYKTLGQVAFRSDFSVSTEGKHSGKCKNSRGILKKKADSWNSKINPCNNTLLSPGVAIGQIESSELPGPVGLSTAPSTTQQRFPIGNLCLLKKSCEILKAFSQQKDSFENKTKQNQKNPLAKSCWY